MKNFCRSLSLVFAAGCFGGLLCSLTLWLFGVSELTAHFGVKLAPKLTLEWLYPRVVCGGLWGLLFLLPYMQRSYFFRGLLWSLAPSFVTLFILLPFTLGKGFLGTKLGDFTPLFVLLFNAVWGLSSGLWLQYVEK